MFAVVDQESHCAYTRHCDRATKKLYSEMGNEDPERTINMLPTGGGWDDSTGANSAGKNSQGTDGVPTIHKHSTALFTGQRSELRAVRMLMYGDMFRPYISIL